MGSIIVKAILTICSEQQPLFTSWGSSTLGDTNDDRPKRSQTQEKNPNDHPIQV